MVKIDIEMPNKCDDCCMCQIAVDSELFDNDERFCCLNMMSVENVSDKERPEFCMLINVGK